MATPAPEDWDLEGFAKAVLLEKSLGGGPVAERATVEVLQESLGRTYHAVALDIDGTVTNPGETRMAPQVVESVARVLASGAYDLFITGRGGATASAASR